MALDAGHGVALWHTDGHPDHGCQEFCEAIHTGATALLTQAVAATELPDRLRRVRDDINESRDAQHWAEGVAMLYDDPGRPLPADEPLDSP
jgi:hypothetical protein